MNQEYDIAIVGGGLVGASLACAIAKDLLSLRVLVIDAADQVATFSGDAFDSRVVALSLASEQFLSDCGIWPLIKMQRHCAYQKMLVWDGEGQGRIEFDCAQVHKPQLGYIVEHSVLVSAYRNRVATLPNISWLAPEKVARVTLSDDLSAQPHALHLGSGQVFTCASVIGADGVQSKVREAGGFTCRTWDYGHTAIVATIETERAHQATAYQRFSHDGPLAYLPLPLVNDRHFSSIVWSLNETKATEMMALDDEAFCHAVAVAMEQVLGRVLTVSARHAVKLQQSHALDYIRPGLALVGDAAHRIHPLAGQGVNLGLKDAQAFGQELTRAVKRGLPVHEHSIYRRYQRQRLGENKAAMLAMEGFKKTFGNDHPLPLMLRNKALSFANQTNWLKRFFIQVATQ